jgi:hypothetical protein
LIDGRRPRAATKAPKRKAVPFLWASPIDPGLTNHQEGLLSAEMSMHAIALGSAISFIAAVITKLL